ncbi:MAG: hypothetical protein EZS28_038470 [Streblomastix strix]|uniref:Uncharacterized protein n=1 Tax=Streblomastix strix TaxID=222440 RepID=A0A5J4U758_9EUKA|nr:MAG: hypothetical protein EZS28_038470 [Streblomastix strix]
MDDESLKKIFILKANAVISDRLGQCTTSAQRALLNIVEFAARRNIKMPLKVDLLTQQQETTLYEGMHESGLLLKVGELLVLKAGFQEKGYKLPFSELVEQLAWIYIMISKGNRIDQRIINIFNEVFIRKIDQFIIKLKEKGNDNQLEKEIQSMTKIFDDFQVFAPLGNLILYSEDAILQKFVSLIHINCAPELNCPHQIQLKKTPALSIFLNSLYLSFDLLSSGLIMLILLRSPDSLPHLASIINTFVSNEFPQLEENIVLFALKEIDYSICSYSNQNQIVSNIPNLIYSLIRLLEFKIKQKTGQDEDEEVAQNIRKMSLSCLKQIQMYEGEQTQEQLVHSRFGSTLARIDKENSELKAFTYENEYDEDYLSRFKRELQNGRQEVDQDLEDSGIIQQLFPARPDLAKELETQIEEEMQKMNVKEKEKDE